MRKSASEAQLKIQEIEKKAMNKFTRRIHLNEMGNFYEPTDYKPLDYISHRPPSSKATSRSKYSNFNKMINYDMAESPFRHRYCRY